MDVVSHVRQNIYIKYLYHTELVLITLSWCKTIVRGWRGGRERAGNAMILSDTCIGCVRLYLLWVDHAVLTPVSLCDHTCPLVVTSCTSGQPQVTTQQAGHWGLTRVSPLNDVKAIRAYRGRPGSTQGEAKRTHPYSVNKNVLHQDYFFQKVVRKGWVWWGISARCQRTCCWLHKDLCITFLNLGFPAHTLTLTISSRSVDQTILFPFKPHVFG